MEMFEKDGRRYTHGTANGYVNGKCRCDVCRTAQTARARQRTRAQAFGRWESAFVDAQPARDHINKLRVLGVGVKQVAKLTGIAPSVLGALVFGRGSSQQGSYEKPRPATISKIRRENEQKILAVTFDVFSLTPGTNVAARGAHRRIQALCAIGYSLSFQAECIGWNVGNFAMLLKRDVIQVKTLLAVMAMFDEFSLKARTSEDSHVLGGITRAKKLAKKNKWVPPLAWDSIDFDDAPPVPDAAAIVDAVKFDLLADGYVVKLNRQERLAAIEKLLGLGLSWPQIDERLGRSHNSKFWLREKSLVADARKSN